MSDLWNKIQKNVNSRTTQGPELSSGACLVIWNGITWTSHDLKINISTKTKEPRSVSDQKWLYVWCERRYPQHHSITPSDSG